MRTRGLRQFTIRDAIWWSSMVCVAFAAFTWSATSGIASPLAIIVNCIGILCLSLLSLRVLDLSTTLFCGSFFSSSAIVLICSLAIAWSHGLKSFWREIPFAVGPITQLALEPAVTQIGYWCGLVVVLFVGLVLRDSADSQRLNSLIARIAVGATAAQITACTLPFWVVAVADQ